MDVREKLKQCLIDELSLEGVKPEDIKEDEPLFGEGLGLDSLDAIEVVVLIKRNFGLEMKDQEEARQAFATFASLAEYIESRLG